MGSHAQTTPTPFLGLQLGTPSPQGWDLTEFLSREGSWRWGQACGKSLQRSPSHPCLCPHLRVEASDDGFGKGWAEGTGRRWWFPPG